MRLGPSPIVCLTRRFPTRFPSNILWPFPLTQSHLIRDFSLLDCIKARETKTPDRRQRSINVSHEDLLGSEMSVVTHFDSGGPHPSAHATLITTSLGTTASRLQNLQLSVLIAELGHR